jgi:hypothetical protein
MRADNYYQNTFEEDTDRRDLGPDSRTTRIVDHRWRSVRSRLSFAALGPERLGSARAGEEMDNQRNERQQEQ